MGQEMSSLNICPINNLQRLAEDPFTGDIAGKLVCYKAIVQIVTLPSAINPHSRISAKVSHILEHLTLNTAFFCVDSFVDIDQLWH